MVMESTANHRMQLATQLCDRLGQLEFFILRATGIGVGLGMQPESGLSETSPRNFEIIINEIGIEE